MRLESAARQNIARKKYRRAARPEAQTAQSFLFRPACGPRASTLPFAPLWKIAHTHTLARCTTDTVSWQYGFAYVYAQSRQKRHAGVCPRKRIATPMADARSRARQSNFKVHLLQWPLATVQADYFATLSSRRHTWHKTIFALSEMLRW